MSEVQSVTDCGSVPPAPESVTSSETATAISTATTQKAESTRPTSLPKPSGLKPPNKIGRLCSNTAPKPAVPISPRSDCSSSDTLRRLSDDLSRKHLSDLIETEEDEVSSSLPEKQRPPRKASISSAYSGTSMDVLWDKHPRRLSEAGLRRSSDHSVVLTEDTDSFIIGERVWVGGTKSGQIAYIGETQFAPGEWAGIVLDEPIGKNDGSVAGVRYFQCPEKRGVFSRLTRLTRVPIITHAPHDASPVSDAGSVFERPPSGSARPRRTLSPNGSIRSMVSSKMNASISTTTNGEVRMGDRVIVSSSRGSKAGTLKYVGPTDFAPGIWAGVELDDPLGKNDGSVDGKRYFDCANRFGLFAPLSKVSRSPSNRKPGACAIHSNGRVTPLRRSNSRESLTSLGTSIASSRVGVRLGITSLGAQRVGGPRASSTPVSAKNALQELLREKQQHLERLMRERELERTEIAKISLQADRAESTVTQLQKESTQVNKENMKLKVELDKLNKMLEDERQKVEDLMFRNEEENINKEDYNKYKEAMEAEKIVREQQIRELEAEVALQAARADASASALRTIEEQHSAEAAVAAEQHKEELTAAHTLSSELQKLLDEAYSLLKEKESEKDSIGKSMSEELTRVKADSEKALNETKTKLAIAQTEFETQVSMLTAKLQLAESKLETEKQTLEKSNKDNSQTISDLNSKLTQLQAAVDDKTLELNKIMSVNKEHELNLNKDITKLKMELSAKVLDLEQLEDTRKKQETVYKNLQDEIFKVKEEHSIKINEYESLLNEVTQQNDKSKSEVLELQNNLARKVKDYENLISESSTITESTEKLISQFKESIHERDKEIIKLKDNFEQTTANFNIKHSKIAEEHRKEIEERNFKIEQLIKEIESHKNTLDQNKSEFDTLNSQFVINSDELKSIREENEKLKKVVNDLTQSNNDLKNKISAMELDIGILTRQHDSSVEKCNEYQQAKEKIEEEYLNLSGQSTDSNEQFNKLSQHLKETEKELQEFKDRHREMVHNYATAEQELKQKLYKLQEESLTENAQLLQSVNEYLKQIQEKEEKIKNLETNLIATNNIFKDAQNIYDQMLDQNIILKKEIESLKLKEQDLINEFDINRKKMEIDIERQKEEISSLKADGASCEVKLMEKVDQLTEAQNDLNYKLEEARQHEKSLQKIVDDMTTELNVTKSQNEKEITEIQTQLSSSHNEVSKYKEEEIKLKELVSEKQKVIKELTLKIEMLDIDFKSNAELVLEKDRQITHLNDELSKLTDHKKLLEDTLSYTHLEIASLKQKYESLIANSCVEESVLKEQLVQMDLLRKEHTILRQEKEAIERNYNVTFEEFSKLKEEHETIKIKLDENINLNRELKKTLEEKENFIKSKSEVTKTELNKLKTLEAEVTQLKQEVLSKNTILQENEFKLNNLNESLQAGSNDLLQKLAQSQAEYEDLQNKHKNEVECCNTTIKSLHSQMEDREKELERLLESKEKVIELQQRLEKSDQDVKKLTNINEAQKLNYEDLNNQLQAQFTEYKKETKHSKNELKVKLNNYEKELQESKEKVKAETEKQCEMQQKFTEAQKRIIELTQKLELVAVQQSSDTEKDNKLETLLIELKVAKQSLADSLGNSEILISDLKSDIECKLKELKQKEELISRLQEEVKNTKTKAEIAERENILMQKELVDNKKNIRDTNDNAIGILGDGDTALQRSIEDKEMLDGQVSFLNSVIVDMQRKNEQLLARVQALEGSSITSEPVILNGRKVRAVAPRLFCDICDVFDAHDTEDCPRQAADVDAPAPPNANKRTPAPPRPYCDICEVFGHSTENCDEEETF